MPCSPPPQLVNASQQAPASCRFNILTIHIFINKSAINKTYSQTKSVMNISFDAADLEKQKQLIGFKWCFWHIFSFPQKYLNYYKKNFLNQIHNIVAVQSADSRKKAGFL